MPQPTSVTTNITEQPLNGRNILPLDNIVLRGRMNDFYEPFDGMVQFMHVKNFFRRSSSPRISVLGLYSSPAPPKLTSPSLILKLWKY